VVFIFDDEDSGCREEIESFRGRADDFASLGCKVVAVRPPEGASSSEAGLPALVSDAPFEIAGRKTTVRRQFDVSTVMGLKGSLPARSTFVIDIAGIVRGVFTEERDPSAHAAFALEKLGEIESGPETEAEAEFREKAVLTEDGKAMAIRRKSAVGRMREKQEKERAARAAAGGAPDWWPFK